MVPSPLNSSTSVEPIENTCRIIKIMIVAQWKEFVLSGESACTIGAAVRTEGSLTIIEGMLCNSGFESWSDGTHTARGCSQQHHGKQHHGDDLPRIQCYTLQKLLNLSHSSRFALATDGQTFGTFLESECGHTNPDAKILKSHLLVDSTWVFFRLSPVTPQHEGNPQEKITLKSIG